MKRPTRKALAPLVKALTWRAFATCDAMLVAYLVTGRLDTAGALVGIGTVTHTVFYMVHERLWTVKLVKYFSAP